MCTILKIWPFHNYWEVGDHQKTEIQHTEMSIWRRSLAPAVLPAVEQGRGAGDAIDVKRLLESFG